MSPRGPKVSSGRSREAAGQRFWSDFRSMYAYGGARETVPGDVCDTIFDVLPMFLAEVLALLGACAEDCLDNFDRFPRDFDRRSSTDTLPAQSARRGRAAATQGLK